MADAFDREAGSGPPQPEPEPEPEPEPLAADGDRAGVPAGGTALDSASLAAQADAEKIELLAHRTELQQQLQAAEEQLKSYHPGENPDASNQLHDLEIEVDTLVSPAPVPSPPWRYKP